MNAEYSAQNIKQVLEKLPGVESVNEIKVKNKIIEYISIKNKAVGKLTIHRLNVEDAAPLFEFYFYGLSERSREFFPPYPLFSPPVNSVAELAERITEWGKEDDWTVLKLTKDGQIIGVCLLKRFKTERPRSGLAVREEFQKKELGVLLQTIVNEQARLLGLRRVYATLAPDNRASLQVHKKCGFKETGRLVPHFVYQNGKKVIDRHDIEMVLELSHG
jgi:RimJ/RimL family protein N-acetyltransferase